MKPLNSFLDACRNLVRRLMNHLARLLNRLSGGKLSPNTITIISLLAHIPIAWWIAQGHFSYAALSLVVFGLFDSLDGALARAQGKASNAGMLLDAATDRMKEVLLYMGGAWWSATYLGNSAAQVWVVAACGGSLLVSYVKAKGETAVTGKLSANEVNRLFQDGLMRYEVRMFVLVVGLLSDRLMAAIVFIAITAWLTALNRLITISRKLT